MTEKEPPLSVTDFLSLAEDILDSEAKIRQQPLQDHTKTLSVRERQLLVLKRIEEQGNQTNMAYSAAAESDFIATTFLSEHTGELISAVLEIVGINPRDLTLQQRVEIRRKLSELGIQEPKETIVKYIEGYLT